MNNDYSLRVKVDQPQNHVAEPTIKEVSSEQKMKEISGTKAELKLDLQKNKLELGKMQAGMTELKEEKFVEAYNKLLGDIKACKGELKNIELAEKADKVSVFGSIFASLNKFSTKILQSFNNPASSKQTEAQPSAQQSLNKAAELSLAFVEMHAKNYATSVVNLADAKKELSSRSTDTTEDAATKHKFDKLEEKITNLEKEVIPGHLEKLKETSGKLELATAMGAVIKNSQLMDHVSTLMKNEAAGCMEFLSATASPSDFQKIFTSGFTASFPGGAFVVDDTRNLTANCSNLQKRDPENMSKYELIGSNLQSLESFCSQAKTGLGHHFDKDVKKDVEVSAPDVALAKDLTHKLEELRAKTSSIEPGKSDFSACITVGRESLVATIDMELRYLKHITGNSAT